MDMNPLLRFYVDNKKYLPGILTIVGISLASGVLKMLAAAFWGKAGRNRKTAVIRLTFRAVCYRIYRHFTLICLLVCGFSPRGRIGGHSGGR